MGFARSALACGFLSLLTACSNCHPGRSDSVLSGASAPITDDPELAARIRAALAAKGADYVPRTRHKNPDGSPRYTNRLIFESSPYLLQHAHNPVHWFAWGDEAFALAKALHRPVFLSIGYSTCHWCHVMEEESFEDEATAKVLNERYVAIKVDREQRPDVDGVYLSFLQAFTGRGGWPMSIWLTPEREPFFGGTYFPPRRGAGRSPPGLDELLGQQAAAFRSDPRAINEQAQRIVARLKTATAPLPQGDFPPASLLADARSLAARRFDRVAGGSEGAPKFPSSFPIRLLLRVGQRSRDLSAMNMARHTLERMRAGGIYDQVAGGFHRYATDAHWLVPHFEKMLYDNGELAMTYLEAGQALSEPRFEATARDVLDYLLRDMRAADGTFYSATDADSLGPEGTREEGAFFTWSPLEFARVLGPKDAADAVRWFGVTERGNYEGRNVLTLDAANIDSSIFPAFSSTDVTERLNGMRLRLRQARQQRPPPLRDDKVIVAWNALTISALARAALVLGDSGYGEAALAAAKSFLAPSRVGKALPHLRSNGVDVGEAFADDHALLAAAALDVFGLTAEPEWLDDATRLMENLEANFSDTECGGYYLSAAQHEHLWLREKPDRDGPIASANSVAANNWLRLYALTGKPRQLAVAEKTLRAFSIDLKRQPLKLDHLLMALDWATDATKEVVVVLPVGRGALAPEARPLLDVLKRTFVPNSVFVIADEEHLGRLATRVPWVSAKKTLKGLATAYVCERGSCKLPTTDPKVFEEQLRLALSYP